MLGGDSLSRAASGSVLLFSQLGNPGSLVQKILSCFLIRAKRLARAIIPTTRMCLELMDALDLTDKRVLDLGCGSGILGIAAVKMGGRCIRIRH